MTKIVHEHQFFFQMETVYFSTVTVFQQGVVTAHYKCGQQEVNSLLTAQSLPGTLLNFHV